MKELIGINLIWFVVIAIVIGLTYDGKSKEKMKAIVVADFMMILLSIGVYIAF